MSEKVTPSVWRGFVEQVARAAERIKAATLRGKPAPQVVAFIDELNTAPTPVLAAIKECFVDGSFRGRPLPTNIFWCERASISSDAIARVDALLVSCRSGAINPATVTEHIAQSSAAAGGAAAPTPAPTAAAQIVDFTGIARSAADTTDFVVHAMPVSLQSLVRACDD